MVVSKRDTRFDIVRAICALEIIAFWHMFDYLPEGERLSGLGLAIGTVLTYISLAGFTFISGFLLQKYEFTSWADVWKFYKNRFKRFYLLFFLSATSLYVVGIISQHPWFVDTWQYLSTLIGLNLFFPPIAMTLWFFSMMILLYFLTPLLMFKKTTAVRIAIALVIMLVFIVLNHYGHADKNLLFYFPFYVIGLFVPKNSIGAIYRNKLMYLGGAVFVGFMAFYLYQGCGDNSFLLWMGRYLIMISGIVFLFSIAEILAKSTFFSKMLCFVSIASMVAYLFHRQFYFVIAKIIGDANGYLSIFTALLIAVPVSFIVSYYIQKLYDRVIK